MKLLIILGVIILFLIGIYGVFGFNNLTGETVSSLEGLNKITLKVAIPCSGHAGLIISELENVEGIEKVEYIDNFKFSVYYDSNKVSDLEILNASIFKDYPAKIIQ